jgi:hypothetical protein
MDNARWVILDMWKTGLLQTPSHLDRKLYYRNCPAWVLPFAQLPKRTTGSPFLWNPGDQNKEKSQHRGKSEVGRRQMASPEDHWDLWTSHLGTRWELGLPDSHLHAQSNHSVISSGRNYHQPDFFCLRITGQTTDPNACHCVSKLPGLRLSSSWGRGCMWQTQPFRMLPPNWR